jgi:fumarylacetoacetase
MRAAGREPLRIVRSNLRTMYWNLAQQLAHLTSNGARIRPGDVCGTGTISGPVPESRACLLEITRGGREPLELPDGERRTYLADGDTVILRGRAAAGDRHIGFGEVTGTIVG